jgi:hypothetical protein
LAQGRRAREKRGRNKTTNENCFGFLRLFSLSWADVSRFFLFVLLPVWPLSAIAQDAGSIKFSFFVWAGAGCA